MRKFYFSFLIIALCQMNLQAQTVLISPTGDGGFESGTTPAANGWTAVNASTDAWVVGATPGVSAGSNCAFVSSNAGSSWTYSQVSSFEHLYKDITIPANEYSLSISFKWKALGEGTTTNDWDNLKVFLAPTSISPTSSAAVSATYQISGPGAVSGMYKLNAASYNAETIHLTVTAGSTYRLIFTWKSDGTDIVNPPAALDEINVVSRPSAAISSTTTGGLFSSPATWVGGVVPVGDNVTIADGATVTIDQAVIAKSITIGSGASGILQWNGTANAVSVEDITVSNGAKLLLYTSAATPGAVTLNVGRNFINNGLVHAATASTLVNFTSNLSPSPASLSGSGTFVGGIVSQLFAQSVNGFTINTTQNITARSLAMTAGSFNTNGKLSLDNTIQVLGQPLNQQVYSIAVTNMGSGYSTANPPTVTIAAPPAGVQATATPLIDDVTGTLRSIMITNPGAGYRANPTVTISGGSGTGAVAIAVNPRISAGFTASSIQKSAIATITGGINIKSEQSVGAIGTSAGGSGYTSAPLVGVALPFGYLNLVTNGGSGYTSAPTVTVSGGTSLTGSTNPTFTVVVAQGKVVSVIPATGGTLWTSPPTLTITGGGGSGATAAYPAGCLATAEATISNGMVDNITITNPGFGYTAAPTPGFVGGGFTTAATAPFSAVGLFNLTLGYFSPAPSNMLHSENGILPANRRINILTMNSASGAQFTGNIELYASAPLTLTNGMVDMGANTLYASYPTYGGTTGSLVSSVAGIIKLSTPGGSVTRNFPFDATFSVATGTGSLATGSTLTSLTASRAGAPSGTVTPSGNPTGTRSYRLETDPLATFGTNPTVTLNYNTNDNLISDNPTLFIAQAAGVSGPWSVVSAASGTGPLSTTGSRTSATTAPGPIVPTGNDYFAWTSTFIPPMTSVTSGPWNSASTWSTGVVPTCSDPVAIASGHIVTVSDAGNVAQSLTINTGGTLQVSSGEITLGCTLNNNYLINNGTLTVTGGMLNVNGNLTVLSGAKFNQSGGAINIDGNAAGVAANSVATGTFILGMTVANAADINLTGGVITIIDPHVGTTSTVNVSLGTSGSINTGVGHTVRFGDGVSTDNGGTNGFQVYSWAGTGLFTFGNVTLEPVTGGSNRFVHLNGTFYPIIAQGNIYIKNGAELRQVGTTSTGGIYFGGNLTVDAGGILTAPGVVYAGRATAATVTTLTLSSTSTAQNIEGAGVFRNAVSSPTANIGSLSINNSNAAGVTVMVPLTVSSTLTLTDGMLNTSTSNLVTLGYSAANTGTLTATNGRINGPLKRWIGASTGTRSFPIGTSTLLKNAVINFTVAPSAGGTLTANFSDVPPAFPNATPLNEGSLLINNVSAQGSWFIEAGDGLTGGTFTATFTGQGATDIIDYTKTTLVARPAAGGDWTLPGTHVATTGSNTAPVVSRTGLTAFGEFAIGGETNVALPVTIQYFKGAKLNSGNMLDWKVSCYNSPTIRMTLERSSDGRSFISLNSSEETSLRCLQPFSYLDAAPVAGVNYYRLKSVDIDGKVTYSQIVALLNKDFGFELISLTPNPVHTLGMINITSAQKGKAVLIIADATGKIHSQQPLTLIAGSNQVALRADKLSAGMYQVTLVLENGERKTLQFAKQ